MLLAIVAKGKKRLVLRLKRELAMQGRQKVPPKTRVMMNHVVTLPVTTTERISWCRRSKVRESLDLLRLVEDSVKILEERQLRGKEKERKNLSDF